MNKLFGKRFLELTEQMESLEKSKVSKHGEFEGIYLHIDSSIYLNWKVKVRNLLSKVCGEKSQHFIQFEKNETQYYSTHYENFQNLKAVFLAAKEDFEGGYLSSVRSFIQAELFDSELEQAKELLENKFYPAAAVIGGVVLETALRELCNRNAVDHGSINKMNSVLAKKGVYNKLLQQRIIALAAVRNYAAHGKNDEYNTQDVIDMLRDIERFLTDYLPD